ncbi:unnamed protein product [Caenorhabditis sp. 36 PRJEB53466]|nr:unnamed protein product [Caenorhabditis sp. 36 PRJEB53466]
MASSSRDKLRDMITTRYVRSATDVEREKHEVETVRAGSSLLQPQHSDRCKEDVIEEAGEDVVLSEGNNYRPIHRIHETPKLVAKRATSIIRDEAAKVLHVIQNTPIEKIRKERYDYYSQRWFHTTRGSEMELIEYVLLHPNHRPFFFAMQCRHLEIEDVSRLVLTSLLSEPRERGQCLARFAIKTTIDMPFRVLFSLLETMTAENDGFQLTDGVVHAMLKEAGGNSRRLQTDKCKEYGELEPELDEKRLMTSRATLTCSVKGKRHVQMQVTYYNNAGRLDMNGRHTRNRYIELEQTVKCMNRRVQIAEQYNILVEYDIEDEMTPLRMGAAPVDDLIEYLASGLLDDE